MEGFGVQITSLEMEDGQTAGHAPSLISGC